MMSIPFSLYMGDGMKSRDFYYCCDEMVNIVLALSRGTELRLGEQELRLEEGELLVVNRLHPFAVQQDGANVFLIFKLDPVYFNKLYSGFSENLYKSSDENGNHSLWKLIAQTVQILQSSETDYRMQMETILLQIALELSRNYVDDELVEKKTGKNHIENIAAYIGEHYKEQIQLSQLAECVHLSEQYLSRYFSNMMGITISEYINIQRLYHSFELLKYTDKNIIDVAFESGFANAKSYYKVCRRYLGKTPSQYRNEQKVQNQTLSSEQYRILRHQALEKLQQHSRDEAQGHGVQQFFDIDVEADYARLHKSWNRMMAFGRASDGLQADMQKQLQMVQREIPFSYVRFHGIFSDDMKVYQEDSDGNAYYNFYYIDELFDFLLGIGLKPFVELGFMPEKLASAKKYMFAWHANISAPKDVDKWKQLIRAFLNHLIERYGRDEVRTWYFELWNDPDVWYKGYPIPVKTGYPFLKATYECVKQIDPAFKVGGVNIFANFSPEKNLKRYFQYFKKENIELDFVSLSLYGFRGNGAIEQYLEQTVGQNRTEDFMIPQDGITMVDFADIAENKQVLSDIKLLLKKMGFTGELIINEWNLVPDPRERINDTCFKSAYFVASMLENNNLVDASAHWTFSDVFEEVQFKEEIFHGGIGFLTRSGLKKPVYYAYELMNRLDGTVIAKGDSFLATRSEDGVISVLLYNYCRLKNYKFGMGEAEDRYAYCEEAVKEMGFQLKGGRGYYVQNCYRINREEGSVYDTWRAMGAPANVKAEQIRFLKNKSLYHFDTKEIFWQEQLDVSVCLSPHEVMLMEWIPVR